MIMILVLLVLLLLLLFIGAICQLTACDSTGGQTEVFGLFGVAWSVMGGRCLPRIRSVHFLGCHAGLGRGLLQRCWLLCSRPHAAKHGSDGICRPRDLFGWLGLARFVGLHVLALIFRGVRLWRAAAKNSLFVELCMLEY